MKIYLAFSWRNEAQPMLVRILRNAGHEVYDFRNPSPGETGFGWKEGASPEQLTEPKRFRDEVLTHPLARAGFARDMQALESSEAVVLALPCGRSAHLELGYAAGLGRRTIVLLDDPISAPELMYLACSHIVTDIDELLRALQ